MTRLHLAVLVETTRQAVRELSLQAAVLGRTPSPATAALEREMLDLEGQLREFDVGTTDESGREPHHLNPKEEHHGSLFHHQS
jgi:hypothetical protein